MKKEPQIIYLKKGKEYYFCTCAKSEDGIFCNGAHQGSKNLPKPFTINESKEYYLCGCKNSSNMPFCDGSHSK